MAWINKFINVFNSLEAKVNSLETNVEKLETELSQVRQQLKGQLIALKNGYYMQDQTINSSLPYVDLNPDQALQFYQNEDLYFKIIDVSSSESSSKFPESTLIPLEELATRHDEITSKTTPLLVISENGTKSILACEILFKLGFTNLYNISGGHQYGGLNSARPTSKENERNNTNLKIA